MSSSRAIALVRRYAALLDAIDGCKMRIGAHLELCMSDKPHGPVSEHFMRHHYGASGLNVENAGAPLEAHGPNEQETQGAPAEVIAALDRMCLPLDASRLGGVTAAEDARCMGLIRDYVLGAPPAAPVQPVAWKIKVNGSVIYEDADPRENYSQQWLDECDSVTPLYAAPPLPQAVQEPVISMRREEREALSPEAHETLREVMLGGPGSAGAVHARAAQKRATDRMFAEARSSAPQPVDAVPVGVVEALRELVAVKELKGAMHAVRSDPYYVTHADSLEAEYERRKPVAWDNARAALAALREHLTGKP